MILTALSLIVGYLTLSVSNAILYAACLGDSDPSDWPFWAIAAICGLGFATLSGWLTALIAQRRPVAHTAALALMLAIVWSLYTFTHASQEPLWALLLNLGVGTLGVMAGGWIQLKQKKQHSRAA